VSRGPRLPRPRSLKEAPRDYKKGAAAPGRKSSMCVTERALIEEPIEHQQHLVLMVVFGLA
jgi:hypothetical protein